MKLLFVGDIVGKPGRMAVRQFVPALREKHGLDLCIGNSENSAGGAGITPDSADELLEAGLDLLTSGNHTFSKREIAPYLDREGSLQLRPANYPQGAPGRGHAVLQSPSGARLGVINLEGRVFMKPLECPFRTADRLIEAMLRDGVCCIFVDMHCEASSEKNAMGHYLDGRVSAVLGSHTHIQTADERVLRGGTAYVTDVGMCGPWDSVIGLRKETAIERFLTQRHAPFELAQGDVHLQGAIVEIDDATGRARSIVRVQEKMPE
ncbi:MAG TPA: TIGR00282 family metallophosphoesterase [Myxococcales bacterium]|jgi:metallophosphoesterase (TIGR00282 family)|nr:TIGR00282 family metallophosphoesterase [Myxococcales bacterium]